MYVRFIQKSIEKWLFKSKIIVIYGPRQAGKTTLVKAILDKFGNDGLYLKGSELGSTTLWITIRQSKLDCCIMRI